jgi:putative transposase
MTEAEWTILSSFLPPPSPCGCSRKRETHEIVNAFFYSLHAGIAWGLLPKDFPPWPVVYRWLAWFRDDGPSEDISHDLAMRDRERAGREASPTAASESVACRE